MHSHGSDRAGREHSNVFWGKSKSGRSHSHTLGPDDGDDVGCADKEEATIGGEITDWGGGIASPVA